MKTQDEIKKRLEESRDFYEGRRDMLLIPDGKATGDAGFRKVVLEQMLSATTEIEMLEWMLKEGKS
jgi:hypothetical protein